MGAEDALSIEDPKEREQAQREVLDMYKEAKRMIREDSGIFEIEKLFRSIHKARLTSPVFDWIRYLWVHPEELTKAKSSNDGV